MAGLAGLGGGAAAFDQRLAACERSFGHVGGIADMRIAQFEPLGIGRHLDDALADRLLRAGVQDVGEAIGAGMRYLARLDHGDMRREGQLAVISRCLGNLGRRRRLGGHRHQPARGRARNGRLARSVGEGRHLPLDIIGRQARERAVFGTAVARRQMAEAAGLGRAMPHRRRRRHRRMLVREPVDRATQIVQLGLGEMAGGAGQAIGLHRIGRVGHRGYPPREGP